MIQERLNDLSGMPEQLKTEAEQRLRAARRWWWDTRETATTSLFKAHLNVLDRAKELADKAGTVAGEDLAERAKGLVDSIEKATADAPIAGYDDMNVREAMNAIREIDRYGLLRVERYEQSNKARKTVLDAIQREVDRRARLAELGA